MRSSDYVINSTAYGQRYVFITSQNATRFTYNCADDSSQNNDGTYRWYICGYAATVPENPLASQYKHLYFYIGQFSQTAIIQNAGINTSLFNAKADINLSNINPSSGAKSLIAELMMPDYSSSVTISSTLTAPTNGWVRYSPGSSLGNNNGWNNCGIYVDGVLINSQSYYYGKNGTNADAFIAPVPKNSFIEVVSEAFAGAVYFHPCKGEVL